MKKVMFLAAAVVASLAFHGCGTYTVAAYSDPEIEYGRVVHITSGMANVPDSDLEFRQFARYLRNALESQGYRVVESGQSHLQIRLSYDMGGSMSTSSVSTDVWGKVSSSTSTSRDKSMTIVAARGNEQVWKIRVMCNDGDDLPIAMPYMLAVAQDYFGKSANVEVGISSGSKKVRDIKEEPEEEMFR